MRTRCVLLLIALRGAVAQDAAASVPTIEGCPACSLHGYCSEEEGWRCVCDEGFTGVDCSERVCPAGTAWADYATQNDTAHAPLVECSRMGHCDRETGECVCRDGFTGHACQRMMCPQSTGPEPCSGNGRCFSMAEAAERVDYQSLWHERTYTDWDENMIFGCVCDEGFTGHDCSERLCPKGDDPMTSGVDEVQLVDCACTARPRCNGTLALSFRGQSTRPIPHDAGPSIVQRRLSELSTIQDVSVDFALGGGSELCRPNGNTAIVTFHRPTGDVESLQATHAGNTLQLAVFADGARSALHPTNVSVAGTKEPPSANGRHTPLERSVAYLCRAPAESSNGGVSTAAPAWPSWACSCPEPWAKVPVAAVQAVLVPPQRGGRTSSCAGARAAAGSTRGGGRGLACPASTGAPSTHPAAIASRPRPRTQ